MNTTDGWRRSPDDVRWYMELREGSGAAIGMLRELREALALGTMDRATEQAQALRMADEATFLAEAEARLEKVRAADRLQGLGRELRRDRDAIEYVLDMVMQYTLHTMAEGKAAGSVLPAIDEGYRRSRRIPISNYGPAPTTDESIGSYLQLGIQVGITLPEVDVVDDMRRAILVGGYPDPAVQPSREGSSVHARVLDAESAAIEACALVIRIAVAGGESIDVAFDLGEDEYLSIREESWRLVAAIEAFNEERDRPVSRTWRGGMDVDPTWVLRAAERYRNILGDL